MKVTTTMNGSNRYVCIETVGSTHNVLVHAADKSPEAALRREAADLRRKIALLNQRATVYEVAAERLRLGATT